ncbi:hypothetical protein Ga0609869_003415 [Rhodovulum iodosum]|uniref:Uncharacterized protein n=1 Tax=Rhodovulum iodosum TaxID=68291 RepID=A0ABV3Y0B4_9RHOB|nr:hypothetical protein [Rhodovulum robiginosum]RSK38107.1 hypothetical protein EJA01_03055 [Rhodovulum robiginosum]
MSKGPERGELRLRLGIGLAGLAAVLGTLAIKGIDGASGVEVFAILGLFFGGTAVWSARALSRRGRTEDD